VFLECSTLVFVADTVVLFLRGEFEDFINELEEDKDLRANINLYKSLLFCLCYCQMGSKLNLFSLSRP